MDENDVNPPTEKQIAYAQHLGIKIPKGATKWELSDLIDEAKDNRDSDHYEVHITYDRGHRYKYARLVAWCLLGTAIYLHINENRSLGTLSIICGIALYLYGKIGQWRHNRQCP